MVVGSIVVGGLATTSSRRRGRPCFSSLPSKKMFTYSSRSRRFGVVILRGAGAINGAICDDEDQRRRKAASVGKHHHCAENELKAASSGAGNAGGGREMN